MIGSVSSINRFGSLLRQGGDHPVSNEELEHIVTNLENDIADGTWFKKNYASTDIRMMPALVNQANNKYPEMNLKFVVLSQGLSEEIKNTIDQQAEYSRLIIGMKDRGIHFCVIDCRRIDGKTSMILFESASFNNMAPAMLALRTEMAIECCQSPDIRFSMVEMDIQRSASECGIFSLALAKKLHIEKDDLSKIHDDNIKGALCGDGMPLPSDKLDAYLPVSFYKHVQGKNRLNEYLDANRNKIDAHAHVNKNKESILCRFNNNLFVIDGKELSISSHKKRIYEYKSLIKP